MDTFITSRAREPFETAWAAFSDEAFGQLLAADGYWSAHSTANPPAIIPTRETYGQLQYAYNYLNHYLFDGQLPNCLITLQRRAHSYGYFCGGRFTRKDGAQTDEIALNPDHFHQGIVETLSTLGHEMAHLWQHHFGKPGRGRYHNREWAARMHAIGLPPSDTGKPDGNETGDTMSNYIDPDGPFAKVVGELHDTGFEITWAQLPVRAVMPDTSHNGDHHEHEAFDAGQEPRSGKRVKYTCPLCKRLSAWARHGALFLCGLHGVPMQPERASGPSAASTSPQSGRRDRGLTAIA